MADVDAYTYTAVWYSWYLVSLRKTPYLSSDPDTWDEKKEYGEKGFSDPFMIIMGWSPAVLGTTPHF